MPVVKGSRQFDKLIDSWDPKMRRAFLESVQNMRESVDLDLLVKMIQQRDTEGALRAVGLNPVDFRPLDSTTSQAYEAGGNHALSELKNANRAAKVVNKAVVQFNVRAPAAERWLATHSSENVTAITNGQRQVVRDTLQAGLERGANPRATALELVGRIGTDGRRAGGVLGLTSSQADYVRNYRAELEAGSRAALDRTLRDRRFDSAVLRAVDGEALDVIAVDKMVVSYANRLLLNRAEGVARTETMAALHEGQQQAMEQLAQGGIARENIVGIWRTAHDKRVRESHASMDGQERQLGEMFETGAGNEIEYPGDPEAPIEEIVNCRCWREFRVDFLAGIQ